VVREEDHPADTEAARGGKKRQQGKAPMGEEKVTLRLRKFSDSTIQNRGKKRTLRGMGDSNRKGEKSITPILIHPPEKKGECQGGFGSGEYI